MEKRKKKGKHVIDNEREGRERFLRLSPADVCGNISGSVATGSGLRTVSGSATKKIAAVIRLEGQDGKDRSGKQGKLGNIRDAQIYDLSEF